VKKKKIIFAAFVLLVFCQKAIAHDIHISYSQAELKSNDLFIKVSYYKDDLTKAVKNWYQGKAENNTLEEFEYIKNYFRVWNGSYDQQITPELVKRTDDGTSMIYELKFSASTFSSIIIDQRILFKEYSEQMNIFFIKAFAKEENHIFTPSKPTLLIKP